MDRFRLVYIAIALVFAIYTSCSVERDFNPLSEDIKAWASFSEGSYWIFQNDSTQSLDSMFVGYNGTDVYPSADNTYDVETVNTTITNSSEELLGFIFGVGFKEIFFQDYNMEPAFEANGGFNLEGEEVVEETVDLVTYNCVVKNVENQTINNVLYENVVYLKINPINSEEEIIHSTTYEYWLARNFWIIKKIYTTNNQVSSWSLLRSNIIQ